MVAVILQLELVVAELGGAGGTCCAGAGGYTGGTGDSDETKAENGNSGGNGKHCSGELLAGGGYFQGGEGLDINSKDRKNIALGGMYNQGHHGNLSDASGSGGIAGNGGVIKTSLNAKIFAYNGNLYTDGTDYKNGLNQCPIYLQNGTKIAKYIYNRYGGEMYNYFELILQSNQESVAKTGYKNTKYESISNVERYITKNSVLSNVDMINQGIGSGAGYIEISNGTYTVDSSLN